MKKSTILQLALAIFTISSIILGIFVFNSGMKSQLNIEKKNTTTSTANSSGTTIPEENSRFTGIILQGAWNLTIVYDDSYSIDPQFLGDQDPNSVLIEIDSNDTLLLTNPDKNNPISIKLKAPSIEFIDSRGKSDINISSINGDYLYINGMGNSSFTLKNCVFPLVFFDLTNSLVTIDTELADFQGEVKDQSILRYKGTPNISALIVSEDSIVEKFNF